MESIFSYRFTVKLGPFLLLLLSASLLAASQTLFDEVIDSLGLEDSQYFNAALGSRVTVNSGAGAGRCVEGDYCILPWWELSNSSLSTVSYPTVLVDSWLVDAMRCALISWVVTFLISEVALFGYEGTKWSCYVRVPRCENAAMLLASILVMIQEEDSLLDCASYKITCNHTCPRAVFSSPSPSPLQLSGG